MPALRPFNARRWLAAAAVSVSAAAGSAGPAPQALVESSQALMRSDPEASRIAAEQALAALALAPDVDLEVRAHTQLCDYQSERDGAAARRHIDAGRALFSQLKRPGLKAALLGCEGELHEYEGDNAQAMGLFQQAVSAAETPGDDEMLAGALYQRGYLRGVQGEFANGLADLRRAITLYERLALPLQAQTALNGVAILYNRMGDHAQARHYYERALEIHAAAGLTRERVVTTHNLGRALESLKDWDAAQRAFESVLSLSREIGYGRGEAYGLRGLASVRNAHGAPTEALALLDRADALQRKTPDERLRGQILLQRGIALRQLWRPADSAAALADALEIFRKADSTAELVTTHGELATSYTAAGEWRAAFEQQVAFKQASDKLLQRQLDERFATLKVEFDSAAKDKENALLQREKQATERALAEQQRASRLQAAVLALAALLAAVLAAVAWRHRRASRAMHRLAMTDELTGLPNRRHVLSRLEALLADADAGGALMIADLDLFKRINDDHGHLVGDEILRAVATVLRDAAREPMALGRLGGEEFVLVLPQVKLAAALVIAERLRAQVQALELKRWLPEGRVTVSIGVTVRAPGDTVGSMLRRADEALYAAKAGGRNLVIARAAREEPPAPVLPAGAEPALTPR